MTGRLRGYSGSNGLFKLTETIPQGRHPVIRGNLLLQAVCHSFFYSVANEPSTVKMAARTPTIAGLT
jgi:hypothetical protein